MKAMEIPPKLESRVQKVLDRLNTRLLRADPRLAEIAQTLTGATRVVLLVVGYVSAIIPIYAWPFTLFCAFVLAFSRQTRRHAIAMVLLTIVVNAIVVATVVK